MSEKKKPSRQRSNDFYESMPGTYTQPYDMFTHNDVADENMPEEASDAVRQRMVRQLVVLVGLLLIQFILFAILLQSAVNLG